MNNPGVTKIIPANPIHDGSVVVKCDMVGNNSIDTLRTRVNDVDVTVIGNKYKDRFEQWDEYNN